jgi:steroid 5-alpha reductase family enzyme
VQVGETIADQQQWDYQSKKYALQAAGKPLTGEYAVGFLRTGMFRYIRHPNYLFEILIWCAYYLFTWSASGVLFNWTLIGMYPAKYGS